MEGKAKEAFQAYLIETQYFPRPEMIMVGKLTTCSFTEVQPFIFNAKIIEWLDSVGIFIHLNRRVKGHDEFKFDEWYFIITNKRGVHLHSFLDKECRINIDNRNLITEAAIKKAVEIYNSKYNDTI